MEGRCQFIYWPGRGRMWTVMRDDDGLAGFLSEMGLPEFGDEPVLLLLV